MPAAHPCGAPGAAQNLVHKTEPHLRQQASTHLSHYNTQFHPTVPARVRTGLPATAVAPKASRAKGVSVGGEGGRVTHPKHAQLHSPPPPPPKTNPNTTTNVQVCSWARRQRLHREGGVCFAGEGGVRVVHVCVCVCVCVCACQGG